VHAVSRLDRQASRPSAARTPHRRCGAICFLPADVWRTIGVLAAVDRRKPG